MQHLKGSKDDATITLELDDSFTGILRGIAHDESEGCTVSGLCIIKVKKPLKIRRLVVWLEGRCKVTLKASGYSVSNTEGTESRTLFSRDNVFIGHDGVSELLTVGEYTYPFKFDMPATLPCSYLGKRGYIRYRLQASAHRSIFSSDIRVSLDIPIKRSLLNDQTPIAELRQTFEGQQHTNKLRYTATAPSISYREGGLVRLNLTMQLQRPETQSVKTVICALRERAQYRTTDSHSNTMLSKSDNMFPLDYNTFHPSQERDYDPKLKADYNALFRLCPRVNADMNSRLIRITHSLVVNIMVEDKAKHDDQERGEGEGGGDSESVHDAELTDSDWGTEDERPSENNENENDNNSTDGSHYNSDSMRDLKQEIEEVTEHVGGRGGAGEPSSISNSIQPNSIILDRSPSATSISSIFSFGRNNSSTSSDDLMTSTTNSLTSIPSLRSSRRKHNKQKRNPNEPSITICSLEVPLVVTCREHTWNNKPAPPPSYNSTTEVPPSYSSSVDVLPPVPIYDPTRSSSSERTST